MTTATILKMLDLSTAHLSEATCNGWLNNEKRREAEEKIINQYGVGFSYVSPVTAYPKGPYGWFVFVDPDWAASTAQEPLYGDVPVDLHVVLRYAAKMGALWVQFDMDGDIDTDLPVFEWN